MLNANSVLVFTDPDEAGLVFDFITGSVGLNIALEPEPAPPAASDDYRPAHYRGPVEFVPQKPVYLTTKKSPFVDDDEEDLLVLLGVL